MGEMYFGELSSTFIYLHGIVRWLSPRPPLKFLPLTFNKLAAFLCLRPKIFSFLYIFLGRFWDGKRVLLNL